MAQYSVDYWIDPKGDGDPDRSDYSDDPNALKKAMDQQVSFDGQRFEKRIFYRRVANHEGEMRNWETIDPESI